MNGLNKAMIIGRCGQKPELKKLSTEVSVVNFSVATNESWIDKNGEKQERVEWHRIVVYGKLAEICSKYLDKGSQCYIEGKLATRKYDKDGSVHYTTEIKAESVQFLGDSKSRSDGSGSNDIDIPF